MKAIHKYNYNSHTKQGDLSLFELKNKPLNGRIRSKKKNMEPIQLPPTDFDPSGRTCTVSGWGTLKSGGWGTPKILQMVDVLVPSNDVCDQMLPDNLPWDKRTNSMICAGGKDKDACQGKNCK